MAYSPSQALAVHLQERDQADGVANLDTLVQDVVASSIIEHKDRDVRTYAACCLADILRLTAPEAPYSEAELTVCLHCLPELSLPASNASLASQDIMELFVDQLDGLSDRKSATYSWRFYLLETLAQVKCFAICSELPEGKEIIRRIFTYVGELHWPVL